MSLAIPLAKGRSRGRSGRTAAGRLTGGGGVPYLPDPPVWGAIAQLGERLHGMQEVRGSIPRSSTRKSIVYGSSGAQKPFRGAPTGTHPASTREFWPIRGPGFKAELWFPVCQLLSRRSPSVTQISPP